MKSKPSPKQKVRKVKAWGILNAYGDLWSHETFYTETGASTHLEQMAEQYPMWDLRKHKVVPVFISYLQ